jgi:DNA-binding transcriptional ArsR family regulator
MVAMTERTDELLVHISDRLKALADPTRLRLLHLMEDGELCVGDLTRSVTGTQANVSKHLAVLRKAGWVRARRAGMNVCYSLTDPVVLRICELVCGSLERQASGLAAELGRSGAAEPTGEAPTEIRAGGS